MRETPCPARARNAEATRNAILVAAREKFAHDSYDNVGIREIAAAAGVDSALISRYFGGKEELFAEVLEYHGKPVHILEGGRDGLAERAAANLADPAAEEKPLEDLLIMLNSASSLKAGELVQASIKRRFHDPVAELIGGENADLRARLFGSAIMGLAIARRVNGRSHYDDVPPDILRARFARILREALAER